MNRFLRWTLWTSATSVALWSVVYFIAHISSSSFTESTMGNLFATILGVLVGVPIALEVNRRQHEATQAATLTDRLNDELERKRKVLTLLRSELSSNLDGVRERSAPIDSGQMRAVFTQSLQDQLWAAFSDGGELRYVNSPTLLAALADAYQNIRHCAMLEEKYLDAVHFPGMRVRQDKYPQDFFLEYLTQSDPSLIGAIKEALKAIDSELKPHALPA